MDTPLSSPPCSLDTISEIKHGFYINLDSRKDRKHHVEQQLACINLDNVVSRFSAVKMAQGAVGCSMSHLRCLKKAQENEWEHVVICEDDIEFQQPEVFIEQLNGFLQSKVEWDVILLAGNVAAPPRPVNKYAVQVVQCQTTTGYIVRKSYYQTLIDNIKCGIEKLIKEPHLHQIYSIDKYWFQLQERDNWFLIIPLTVVQREDYSNIEKRCTNYKRVMLDLEKPYLLS